MTTTKRKTQIKESHTPQNIKECRGQLLAWYDKHRRILPWRTLPGQVPDPYHVWLSEIMLQQTTVTAVKPYFEKFLHKWPTVHDLARAPLNNVMDDWAGLGYYNRAKNLHKCANEISNNYNGIFPNSKKELKELPGIGDYTSAAIKTIAFNEPDTVVDGNIERIISRYFNILNPLPKSKKEIKERTSLFFKDFNERPGDLAQAFMDLGATICIAKTPRCAICPISAECIGLTKGTAPNLPKKEKKKPKPQKHGNIYWIVDKSGKILLHRRPDSGLLSNTLGLPTSEWVLKKENIPLINNNKNTIETDLSTHISHSFTHFDLRLNLKLSTPDSEFAHSADHFWCNYEEIIPKDFPTVFRKAVDIFLAYEQQD